MTRHHQPARDALRLANGTRWRALARLAAILLAGACWIALLYQVPTRHSVDIGGYDAAYVQGFHDPQIARYTQEPPAYLAGSDGSARWSRDRSYLLFPQAGLPARLTLRLRGWRAQGSPPRVKLLLNGREQLAEFTASRAWQEHSVTINGGLRKASDVVIEIQSTTTTLPDGRRVGVLLDSASYRVQPTASGLIVPYPTQVAYGALLALLLWLATGGSLARTLGGALLVGLAFLLLCRLQPPYPYPLRWLLPGIAALLAALLALRHLPALLLRRPALADGLALAGIAAWTGWLLRQARQHVTLSVPGVENDFRVFATRTDSLAHVLQADSFYNLGYPLLLWLVQPLTQGNAFLAARLLAALSGALLLLAGWWLARTLLREQADYQNIGALLALLLLACSPLVVQYALYVGSDMPFAALVVLALAAAGTSNTRQSAWPILLAGCAAGAAFLVRHLGLGLLPWGVGYCLLRGWQQRGTRTARPLLALPLLFACGFLLVALPQLLVNTWQTGEPLYNHQAKNVWLAVYGDIDWSRWHEVPNSIGLSDIVLRDPARFLGNWWRNVQGFLGSGAEDTSEFGRALQLRLLAWPANWLAIVGLLGWLWLAARQLRALLQGTAPQGDALRLALLAWAALYVLAVCLAFILPRFFLPLAPIYAAAAAWAVGKLTVHIAAPVARLRWQLAALLLLLALLSGSIGIGTRSVLQQQPAAEVDTVRLTLERLQPGERVLTRLPAEVPLAKYSALAHLVIPWQQAAQQDEQATLAQAQRAGAAYLLWHSSYGPPPLPESTLVGSAGHFLLYQLDTPPGSSGPR